MKKKLILSIAFIMLMISFGCKKSSTTADYGSTASGVYTGNWTVVGVQFAGTCEITKVSNTSVNLKITMVGQSASTFTGLSASDGGSGKINLSYSDVSATINGVVDSKSLSLTINSGGTTLTFAGTKP